MSRETDPIAYGQRLNTIRVYTDGVCWFAETTDLKADGATPATALAKLAALVHVHEGHDSPYFDRRPFLFSEKDREWHEQLQALKAEFEAKNRSDMRAAEIATREKEKADRERAKAKKDGKKPIKAPEYQCPEVRRPSWLRGMVIRPRDESVN